MIGLSEPYDYTKPDFDRLVEDAEDLTANELDRRLMQLQESDVQAYLALGTAASVVASMEAARRIHERLVHQDTQLRLYVVEPVFREGRRLLPRSVDNPHGEDALRFKMERFEHISAQFPRIHFEILVVDDGCDGDGNPELISSVVARRLIAEYHRGRPGSRVRATVLLLNDLIAQAPQLDWGPRMKSAQDSRKGGSILAGFAYARWLSETDKSAAINMFVDCDADLSIHPDQTMLLAELVLSDKCAGAIASRRVAGAVSYVDPERDRRGQTYIRTWQALLPSLAAQVTDTNRGLKVYSRAAIEVILRQVEERTFPYQVECLLALVTKAHAQIAEVPVSYVDSVQLSTQRGTEPAQSYEDQLQRIRQMTVRYER